MKFVRIPLTTVIAVALTLAAATFDVRGAETLQSLFNAAKQEHAEGKYAEAAEKCRRILKAKPSYVYATHLLKQCELAIQQQATQTPPSIEGKLKEIIVPSVDFEGASLNSVLTYLTQKSTELSNGDVTANFVYRGTPEQLEKALVTIELSNNPMTEVIRYVGLTTNTVFVYEPYAVVGYPREEYEAKQAAESDAAPKAAGESKEVNNSLDTQPQKSLFD